VVGGEPRAVARRQHRHGRMRPQQLIEDARRFRRQVLQQHERHAAVGRHQREEFGERRKPAGRGAKRHHKAGRRIKRCACSRHGRRRVVQALCSRRRYGGNRIE